MNDMTQRVTRLLATLCALLIIEVGFPSSGDTSGFVTVALADDDGGGGDDGGGDDDGGNGGSADDDDDSPAFSKVRPTKNFNRQKRNYRAVLREQRRAAPALPRFARSELVVRNLDSAILARLTAAGYVVLEQASLGSTGQIVHRLRVPARLTLTQARADIAGSSPQAAVDFNHYYQPNADDDCVATQCLARHMIGWAPMGESATACSSGIHIGMIDTAINTDHDALSGSRIEVKRLTNETLPLSGKQHGTAVAALLVGDPSGRSPGLLPGAELIAVDTFHRFRGQSDVTDVYTLVKALDFLDSRSVKIINMSLTGPANAVLEKTIKRLSEKGIVLVAAAGNDGPGAKPVYPAAYADVVAVTAVDRQKRPYRRAVRGPHIDLAAPGVDVWIAASVEGSRPRTGTSFATPFVTAAIALAQKREPDVRTDAVLSRVTSAAEDLGTPGKDDIFGWGLLNPRGLCG